MTSIPDGLKIRPAFISTAVSANTLAVAPNTSSSHHNMFNRLSVALSLVVTFCSLTSAAPQATSAEQLEQDQETGQLLEKVLPTLESTVELVDRHDVLPEKTINPFDHDQASNQSSIDKLLDDAIEALEVAKVTEYRNQIRETQQEVRVSKRRIAEYKRKQFGAAPKSELTKFQRVTLVKSREDYDDLIKEENEANEERARELVSLKAEFVKELKNIGLDIDDAGVDALLGAVSGDEFISMLTVFRNIKSITKQLQTLTDDSGESMDVAKRYYGMYVVLVQTMDRLQMTFVNEIETVHIPKLYEYSAKAQDNIDEANELIESGGGDAGVLEGNIESNRLTQTAAEIYIDYLRKSARVVSRENGQTKKNLATAQNTYKTVRLSGEVATLMRTGRQNFESLMQLELPKIRDFGNEAVKKEFSRMTLELRGNK